MHTFVSVHSTHSKGELVVREVRVIAPLRNDDAVDDLLLRWLTLPGVLLEPGETLAIGLIDDHRLVLPGDRGTVLVARPLLYPGSLQVRAGRSLCSPVSPTAGEGGDEGCRADSDQDVFHRMLLSVGNGL